MTDARTLSRTQQPRRYAGIERVQFPGNPGATTALSQIDETLRRFFGNRGPFLERAVTWADLVGSGVVRVNIPASGGSAPGDPIVTPGAGTGEEDDSRIPPAPTGLTASAAFVTIILEWVPAQFSFYGHTEIWRSSTNNLAEATNVGETQAALYPDAVGQSSVTYYYWIRFISKTGRPGPFNAVPGVSATTAPNIPFLFEQLAGQIDASFLHQTLTSRIDLIDGIGIGSVNARIADEAAARSAAVAASEASLMGALTVESSARTAAVFEESQARAAAIQTLTDNLVAESSARIDAVSQEAAARALAIQDEAAARGAAITGEATARQTADDSHAASISALTASVAANTAAIQAEQTARAGADSSEAAARQTLAAQLRGEYTGGDLSQVTTGLLYEERLARATADTAFAQQIALLSAGSGEQFDYAAIWYFDTGIDGWTGNGAPTNPNAGWLRPANHATDPYGESPGALGVTAGTYTQVRMRVRKVGTPTWEGNLWWKAGSDSTWDAVRRMNVSEPSYDGNGIAIVTFTVMWTGTINQIRIDLSADQTASDYFEIDWVAIGRPSPGASAAALLTEQQARASADAAEVTARQALSAKLTGLADPGAVTLSGLTSGLLYEERTARASADGVLTSSVSALTSRMGDAEAAILSEASARAAADSSEVTARQALSSKLTGMPDPSAATLADLTSGLIYDERIARSSADGSLATQISSVSAIASTKNRTYHQAAAPTTGLAIGDVWLDSTNNNKQSRWSGSAWVAADDARIAANAAAIQSEQAARANADAAEASARDTLAAQLRGTYAGDDINAVTSGLIYSERQARASADGTLATQITTLESNAQTWDAGILNSAESYVRSYAYSKSATDSAIASSNSAIAARLNVGGDTYTAIAQAQATASAKNATFVQGTAPTATKLNDLWINTADSNRAYRWNGTSWVLADDQRIGSTVAQLQTLQARVAAAQPTIVHSWESGYTGWINASGAAEVAIVSSAEALVGGNVLEIGDGAGNDSWWGIGTDNIPLDNNTVYKITARHRRLAGVGKFYLGFAGVGADGEAYVNVVGANSFSNQFYTNTGTPVDSGWVETVGFLKAGGAGATNATSLTAPLGPHANARYIRPLMLVNHDTQPGRWQIDYIKVEPLANHVASLQVAAEAQADQITGLRGQFTVKTDLNGYVSGFGFASEAPVNGNPSSEFKVIANRFSIAPVPTDPGAADGAPFFHLTVPTTINGVLVPAGTYMKSAFIHNAAIGNAQIQNAAINDAKIVSLSVAKLLGGSLSVGEYIQSSNYISGTTGFRINANGAAEFSGVIVRGTVYAAAGQVGGLSIGASDVRSANFAAGGAGFKLAYDGSAEFNNLTARGNIQAQTLAAGASIQSPAIFGGAYTAAYAWPASGGGFHLSSSGLLLGNGNTGSYFQVTAAGNVYAPGFSIVGGAMTVSALNVIGTGQVVNEAITVPRSAYAAGPWNAGGAGAVVVPISLSAPPGVPSYTLIGSVQIDSVESEIGQNIGVVDIAIRQNGSIVSPIVSVTVSGEKQFVPIHWRDTSGTGGTFDLWLRRRSLLSDTLTISYTSPFLLALGTKR